MGVGISYRKHLLFIEELNYKKKFPIRVTSYSWKKDKIITGGSYLQKSLVIPAKILLENVPKK